MSAEFDMRATELERLYAQRTAWNRSEVLDEITGITPVDPQGNWSSGMIPDVMIETRRRAFPTFFTENEALAQDWAQGARLKVPTNFMVVHVNPRDTKHEVLAKTEEATKLALSSSELIDKIRRSIRKFKANGNGDVSGWVHAFREPTNDEIALGIHGVIEHRLIKVDDMAIVIGEPNPILVDLIGNEKIISVNPRTKNSMEDINGALDKAADSVLHDLFNQTD